MKLAKVTPSASSRMAGLIRATLACAVSRATGVRTSRRGASS